MNQSLSHSLPQTARLAFIIHLVVALIVGAALLVIPAAFVAVFGYPDIPLNLVPLSRAFGAMILGFGGTTSWYAARSPAWTHVEYIVRGEIAFLTLQTLIFLLAALTGVGPALGNWCFAVLSALLLGLFATVFAARPK